MKQIFAIAMGGFIIIALLLLAQNFFKSPDKKSPINVQKYIPQVQSTPTPIVSKGQLQKILFVPYWSLDNQIPVSLYDTVVFFGIAVSKTSIDTTDPGYNAIPRFIAETKGSRKRLLTVRMINTDINNAILSSQASEQAIINSSTEIAKKNGFNGVVLDFEISAIAFDSVTKDISDFATSFSRHVHDANLTFYTTAYGDTFYRVRPFDIHALSQVSDGIMVMAYDFHKAKGDAGPNFPLQGANVYGYDMGMMTDDFLRFVTPDKLTVIFGMYGYDWPIDKTKQTIGTASSLTTSQALKKFTSNCVLAGCFVRRDKLSAETEVTYTGNNKVYHDVWFEDNTSVAEKTAFLQTKHIVSVGYWAYSYF